MAEELFRTKSLREELAKYAPPAEERNLEIDHIEMLYEMWKNPTSTPEEKDFAVNSLVAAFLSIYNTQKYCLKYNTNTGVVDREDLDSTIATTVYRALTKYKSDGGTKKDNFLRYCIAAIKNELYKQHKVSLPFYMPHMSSKVKKEIFEKSKARAFVRDSNGSPMLDEDGNPLLLKKRKVYKLRDGTKCNKTLAGDLIEINDAKKIDDDQFELDEIYSNIEYTGLKSFSLNQGYSDTEDPGSTISSATDYDITQSCVGRKEGDYKNLDSGYWDTSLMNADFIEKLRGFEHGDIVISRYGLDRGYARTVKEVAKEFKATPKYVNYWVDNVQAAFARKYPNYFKDYFAA